MLLTIVNVTYVLVAIAMIVLILMQRGSGAAAGSGFGGGASATVFGARGSANFLSTATKWLAVVFFAMSLGMAWNASRTIDLGPVEDDIGVMSEMPGAPSSAPGELPVSELPAAPPSQDEIPAVPEPAAPESASEGDRDD